MKLTGEDLIELGYTPGKAIGTVLKVVEQNFSEIEKEEILALLLKVFQYPENFLDDAVLSPIANDLVEMIKISESTKEIPLKESSDEYSIYGKQHIEPGALSQMEIAMKLPVTVAGALMPDAHQGYGLPIGGVLATNNAVIPYGVGVDIGCRMALSIFDVPETHFMENHAKYKRELIAWTKFGAGNGWQGKYKAEHSILGRSEFNATPFIKCLHDKASAQLGSSGSMTAPVFLVRGKGEESAINSASHGAGRQMSRTQAIKTVTPGAMQKILKEHGVTLIGAGLDEAPFAYKDINTVMAAQSDLVDTIAKFTPKMVRMADDGSKED